MRLCSLVGGPPLLPFPGFGNLCSLWSLYALWILEHEHVHSLMFAIFISWLHFLFHFVCGTFVPRLYSLQSFTFGSSFVPYCRIRVVVKILRLGSGHILFRFNKKQNTVANKQELPKRERLVEVGETTTGMNYIQPYSSCTTISPDTQQGLISFESFNGRVTHADVAHDLKGCKSCSFDQRL